jgi:hypothetical protein
MGAADHGRRPPASEVSGHLRVVSGFRSTRRLRPDNGQEAMLTSITYVTSQRRTPEVVAH